MKKWILIYSIISFLIFPELGFSFTFTATASPETCSGNGTINFTSSNTDPNGTLVYIIYKLPNTTIPLATILGNSLGGLSSGTYQIIAKETVGNVSTTQQQSVTIADNISPLVYSVNGLNQACSATSDIAINVTSGTASTYEIFSGPVTFQPQSSNIFSGLPVGVYSIRVFDICGVGSVTTYTATINQTALSIGAPVFTSTTPASCATSIVTNTLTPASGTVIGYPISVQYIIHPPDGSGDITYNSIYTSGNPISQDISHFVPLYVNQNYNFEIQVTDNCGTTIQNNFLADQNITVAAILTPLDCNKNYITVSTTNFTPPYTLNFTSYPTGFSPNTFNSSYPGPYTSASNDFGSITNPVPFGTYSVTITDSCGRTNSTTLTILDIPPIPSAVGSNNGCTTNTGDITLSIPNNIITSAIIIDAPSSFPNTLPFNISNLITNGTITLSTVPIGTYTFQLTDTCNDVFPPTSVTIPLFSNLGLTKTLRPGCDLQKSSIKISSKNGHLTNVTITSAPAGFPHSMPYNVSFNIAPDGNFYMNGLISGNYSFTCIDQCNFSNSLTDITITGYAITANNLSMQVNCGSFDIPLNFTSNGTAGQSFWLQKLIDPNTNTWGYPGISSVVYPTGTVPNATNSYPLTNNTTNYNLMFNGTFRVLRRFLSYNNGQDITNGIATSGDKNCFEVLSPTLSFHQALEIIDIYRMPCSPNGNQDVVIMANGVQPLHYKIIEKNGVSFIIDNGNSNIFTNLASGVYLFVIEDNCGNSIPRTFDVSALLSLVNITQPNDVIQCKDIITNNETFDLTQENSIILGSQSASDYTLTYYTSILDAQMATNPITNLTNFDPTSNPQQIFIRLIFNPLPSCYETGSFNLIVGQKPRIDLNSLYLDCFTNSITLDASPHNLPTTTYSWSDGTTLATDTISQYGINNIAVTATNSYLNSKCSLTKNITVTLSAPPQIDHVDTVDWTDNENSITIYTTNPGAFEYSLDGVYYQDSNTFENLEAGLYTVYVRDKAQCGIDQQVVGLLNYPKYFTPNGDGYNEFWHIKNAHFEPDFKVAIYDRFGKLITSFNSKSSGWDGTYNGKEMFATDYWFVVTRQDGRILKGHFSLKR